MKNNSYHPLLPGMRRVKNIHFIGIGGSGMGGIAEVLLNEGYFITGSDLSQNALVDRLSSLGAKIHIGHAKENVSDADVVVQSSAIKEDNVEIAEARNLRIPVVKRAQMLSELMRFRYGIAIAGTHGKTTTTSLAASVLAGGGLDPTFIIGGRLNSAGTNARLGSGYYLVAEADESDASFLHLQPTVSVVTNIDADHMETYGGDFENLKNAFVEFLHRMPFYGLAVLCIDDEVVKSIIPRVSRAITTYGFSEGSDVRGTNYRQVGMFSIFTVKAFDMPSFEVKLHLPGEHNALNALATIAIALELDVSIEAIQFSLEHFQGVGRRFQPLGNYCFKNGKAEVIDDYGHHPKEISMVIKSARQCWTDQRLVMVFQPHRYSRTRDLFEDFSEVLSKVDVLFVLPVYAAGENPIPGADSKKLCGSIRMRGRVDPIYVDDAQKLPAIFSEVLKDNDVIIFQGAGSISKIAHNLVDVCKK